jgi:hypothetical protein
MKRIESFALSVIASLTLASCASEPKNLRRDISFTPNPIERATLNQEKPQPKQESIPKVSSEFQTELKNIRESFYASSDNPELKSKSEEKLNKLIGNKLEFIRNFFITNAEIVTPNIYFVTDAEGMFVLDDKGNKIVAPDLTKRLSQTEGGKKVLQNIDELQTIVNSSIEDANTCGGNPDSAKECSFVSLENLKFNMPISRIITQTNGKKFELNLDFDTNNKLTLTTIPQN